MTIKLGCALVLSASVLLASDEHDDWQARARMAHQLARERNDRALVAEVEKVAKALPEAKDDTELRRIEVKVGIDSGGWSMAGQPLFHPTAAMLEQSKALHEQLATAMASDDASKVHAATKQMLSVLGDQAGVPDGRRPGRRAEVQKSDEAQVARWFVAAMKAEGSKLRQIMRGEPLPDQMLRLYGGVLRAVCDIRPAVQAHVPEAVKDIVQLAQGCATILLKLQQPAGHFPFPDLRGKNIRFGDMITRAVKGGQAETRDGWVVSADPDGGSQFDTGVCGGALLAAGEVFGNVTWTKAGLRAADWAMAQPCVANFNYNAFSVSLLAQAFRVSHEAKYRDAALHKFRVGVAPGQAPNGRWLDAHNARSVYHVIILRGLGDLASVVDGSDRMEIDAVTKPAIAALLTEFDAMGITVDALPELLTLRTLYPDDARLKHAIEAMASSFITKSTQGERAKFAVSPDQFAALARVWK
jgi:hypothetical protein